jgi:DNA repair exonuclease SbcCD ATPase subunit
MLDFAIYGAILAIIYFIIMIAIRQRERDIIDVVSYLIGQGVIGFIAGAFTSIVIHTLFNMSFFGFFVFIFIGFLDLVLIIILFWMPGYLDKYFEFDELKKEIDKLQKHRYAKYFENDFFSIKSYLKTKKLEFVEKKYKILQKKIEIYQSKKEELFKLHDKLNKILDHIGHDSYANKIREHIKELKQLQENPLTILQINTRINSEIPRLNKEVRCYNQKLNELDKYERRLKSLKTKKFQMEINKLIKKCDSPENLDILKHQIPLIEHELFIDRINVSKQIHPNIYLDDIIEEGEKLRKNQDESQLDKLEMKIIDREKLEKGKKVLHDKVKTLQQKYIIFSDNCHIKKKADNIFTSIIEKLFYETKTENDTVNVDIVKKESEKLEQYLNKLDEVYNRYKTLVVDCRELRVEKDCCVFLNEIKSKIEMVLINAKYEWKIEIFFEEIEKIIEDKEEIIYSFNDTKNKIENLADNYIEFVEKINIKNMWEQAASRFDKHLLDDIDSKIVEGNEIIKKYIKLKEKIELIKNILPFDYPSEKKLKLKKTEEKLEKGKKEVKKDILDAVEKEINELMPPAKPDIGFGRRNINHPGWTPDWDSPAQH